MVAMGVVCAGMLTGCSAQQGYASAQAWQRSQCLQIADAQERRRCLDAADTPYSTYQRQSDSIKTSP